MVNVFNAKRKDFKDEENKVEPQNTVPHIPQPPPPQPQPQALDPEKPAAIIKRLKQEEIQLADEKKQLLVQKEQLQQKVKALIENSKANVDKLKAEVDLLKFECADLSESAEISAQSKTEAFPKLESNV